MNDKCLNCGRPHFGGGICWACVRRFYAPPGQSCPAADAGDRLPRLGGYPVNVLDKVLG